METLVVVSHQRNHNQYYGKNRGHGPVKFGSFKSQPLDYLSGVNCRSFESGSGLLRTPLKSSSPPVNKNAFSSSFSPKTLSPYVSKNHNGSKRYTISSSIPIPIKFDFDNEEGFHFPERWAGPAYSNSPPPSSLPLPKFSLPPRRTVSLDFPRLAFEIDMHPVAKSAPASPTRGPSLSPDDLFGSADSATRDLRRILNLDNE